jgi:hypothetical protein
MASLSRCTTTVISLPRPSRNSRTHGVYKRRKDQRAGSGHTQVTARPQSIYRSPVVRNGSPVALPPVGSNGGGDTLACGRGGGGEPIPTKGQTLFYLWYSIIPVRARLYTKNRTREKNRSRLCRCLLYCTLYSISPLSSLYAQLFADCREGRRQLLKR